MGGSTFLMTLNKKKNAKFLFFNEVMKIGTLTEEMLKQKECFTYINQLKTT